MASVEDFDRMVFEAKRDSQARRFEKLEQTENVLIEAARRALTSEAPVETELYLFGRQLFITLAK